MPEQHLPYAAQQQIPWTATLSAPMVIHVAKTMMKLASWGACSLVAEMLYWGPRWVCLMGCQRLGSRFFLRLVYHFFFGRNTLILQNLCRLGDFSCREGEWSNICGLDSVLLKIGARFAFFSLVLAKGDFCSPMKNWSLWQGSDCYLKDSEAIVILQSNLLHLRLVFCLITLFQTQKSVLELGHMLL